MPWRIDDLARATRSPILSQDRRSGASLGTPDFYTRLGRTARTVRARNLM